MTQPIGNLKIENRYRTELRFTSSGYKNRFRYRLGFPLPFGKERNGYKPFLTSLSNELFFTDSEPHFERNRTMLTGGIRLSKKILMQIGYVKQYDYKINDETGRDFLLLSFNVEHVIRGHPREININD